MTNEKMVEVPINWLESLLIYAQKAEEGTEKINFEMSMLIAFIESAKTIIKYSAK